MGKQEDSITEAQFSPVHIKNPQFASQDFLQ